MSKRLWCGVYVVSVAILIATIFIGAILAMLGSDEVVGPNIYVGAISILVLGYLQFLLVHTITTLVLLFKMWKGLEDGVTPVTAGKAVGFLFIPFFNIYWFFRVWGGYPGEYNKFAERNRLSAPPISSGIFMAFVIAVALSAVLVVPILILPFVTIFLIARGCDAINNLELSKSASVENRPLSPAEFVGTPENPRSKVPIFALAGMAALFFVVVLGFGVYVWINMHPKLSADVLPAAVGDFKLEQPGSVSGSFFGGQFKALDNFYASDSGGNRQAIRYNVFQLPSEAKAILRIESACNGESHADPLKAQDGSTVGRMCIDSGSVWMQVGRYYLWAHAPSGYDLEKLKAKEASMDAIVAFVRALPLAKGAVFSDTKVPVNTSTTAPSETPSTVVLSNTSAADFTVDGKDFYDETNSSSPAAKAKYKGKTVQLTSRVAISSGDNVMLNAGGSGSIFAYFDAAQESSIQNLKRDERVVIKCAVEVEYSIRLGHCVLVENKGIISPTDMPDVTFTADEYWNTIEGTSVSIDTKMKKQNDLAGKIIKITGKVKDMAGSKNYLMAGNDNEIPCFPDVENNGMFSSLTEGQTVSFLAVGGSSLSHCVVASN